MDKSKVHYRSEVKCKEKLRRWYAAFCKKRREESERRVSAAIERLSRDPEFRKMTR